MAVASATAASGTGSKSEIPSAHFGCWRIETPSAEGGYYRMCFATKGRLSLMSYNELFREAFVSDARYQFHDQKLHIGPVQIELWPFSSKNIVCDVLIRPRTELQLFGCVSDDAQQDSRKFGTGFSGEPWTYDGED